MPDTLILFANSRSDLETAAAVSMSVNVTRLTLDKVPRLIDMVDDKSLLWIDPSIDSFPSPNNSDWLKFYKGYEIHDLFLDPDFLSAPSSKKVHSALVELLDEALDYNPHWLSVPQLTLTNGIEHHKLNRLLAKTTKAILKERDFEGELILPVVLTHRKQYTSKVERLKRTKLAKRCLLDSGAKRAWIVATDVADETGVASNQDKFRSLLAFHQELRDGSDPTSVIAGPYWALGTLLWAKGLAESVATSAGNGYKYSPPGSFVPTPGKKRIALAPFKKRAIANAELRTWLSNAVMELDKDDPDRAVLLALANQVLGLTKETAKRQVAKFWYEWFEGLRSGSPSGRSVALYQEFSRAFVLGKSLSSAIPSEAAKAKRPYVPAQDLMLVCL